MKHDLDNFPVSVNSIGRFPKASIATNIAKKAFANSLIGNSMAILIAMHKLVFNCFVLQKSSNIISSRLHKNLVCFYSHALFVF